MSSQSLYDQVCLRMSRITTRSYSTSFSLGIRCLASELRNPIYSIYAFVRFADEIVDTFHDHNKGVLLQRFTKDTWQAIDERISLNPILHSFQQVVNAYRIERELIARFLSSMEMDLQERRYDQAGYEQYILGSAEVVGLMCLRVFCKGNEAEYQALRPAAMKLGAAFQKVNFLRDLQADFTGLGRSYFPSLNVERFDEASKRKIEEDIASDFQQGFEGIRRLPRGARLGVYIAYRYYLALFHKIRRLPSSQVLQGRVRVRNRYKLALIGYSYVRHQLNLI